MISFYYWKKDIRHLKSRECENVLNNQLFLLRPSLCTPLLSLRSYCVEIYSWVLHKFDNKITFTLPIFISTQEQARLKVTSQLDQLHYNVRSLVLKACEDDLQLFLVKSGFRDKNVQKISHAERAAHRTECRKLTKFIRLADYLVVDTLVSLAMDRTKEVLTYFNDILYFKLFLVFSKKHLDHYLQSSFCFLLKV